MAQGPSDTILVAIRITLRIRESKVRNPDPLDRRRFVLSEYSFLVAAVIVDIQALLACSPSFQVSSSASALSTSLAPTSPDSSKQARSRHA